MLFVDLCKLKNNTMELKYNEFRSNCRSFQLDSYPEVIHIIKTGFIDLYIVVYEDAYELELGKTLVLSENEIKQKFGIIL